MNCVAIHLKGGEKKTTSTFPLKEKEKNLIKERLPHGSNLLPQLLALHFKDKMRFLNKLFDSRLKTWMQQWQTKRSIYS